MDRLRSTVVVIAAVLGFLGLFLLGEAESSARGPMHLASRTAPVALEAGSDAPRACSADEPTGIGAFCALDAGPAHAPGLRSGGATR